MIIDHALQERIEALMRDFVRIYTPTGTSGERDAERFYLDLFASMNYFSKRSELAGLYEIPGDCLNRSIPWCLVKGSGGDTVVLLHHYDVVDTDDYRNLRDLATEPDALASAFREERISVDDETARDLESGEWIFGRGTADMKGGAAIQAALLERYAEAADAGKLQGNLLLIGVPDEENISAGGRAAPALLKKLKDEHALRYVLAMNAEPNERVGASGGLGLFIGSIGKIMPLIYVRGKLSHAGMVYDGLNPIKVLSKIVDKLDIVPELIDGTDGIISPAPTFLYMKDTKNIYDVSLPGAASGYMNVMFLRKSVGEIMELVRERCTAAFGEAIADVQQSFDAYSAACGNASRELPWKANVKLYSQLRDEAVRDSGDEFERSFAELIGDIKGRVAAGEMTLVEASHAIIEHTLLYVRDVSPTVVIALTPPYYPVVSNAMLGETAQAVDGLCDEIIARAKSEFGAEYIRYHIIGMSDLSYFMQNPSSSDNAYISDNMLLWKDIYNIPFDALDDISMPVLNIGPLGKDIHEYTERVLKEDLLRRSPDLMAFAIERILNIAKEV
ncbi:MAG: M20/M25/M40 family metallo-hydrolase [Clostridiales Family XIII bacterium]|jgi:arginine utilization protein RocB|nr:M20/M25/M40 family metallo-hydrolase [Clostridiales Family XIII bacterium]